MLLRQLLFPFRENGHQSASSACVKHLGRAKATCVWLSGLAGALLARCHAEPVRCPECTS